MIEKLTPRSKWFIDKATEVAKQLNHSRLDIDHLLLTFLFCEDAKTIRIFHEIDFDYESVRNWMTHDYFEKKKHKPKKFSITAVVDQVIIDAADFAKLCNSEWVAIDHIFIGILTNINDLHEEIKDRLSFDFEIYKDKITKYFHGESLNLKSTSSRQYTEKHPLYERLHKNGEKLNDRCASADFILIDRDEELEKVQCILNRKYKNNVLILGESGVGKTSIVEYLAYKIANGTCSHYLNNKVIFNLNLTSLVSGAKYRGDFEAKLQAVIEEAKDENVILFIDEIHTLVGAGDAEGSLDASNILKPYLSNGQITIIGATTNQEYRKKIFQDKALSRRFDVVHLHPPSKAQTENILKSKRDMLENFHLISVSDEVLSMIINLSDKYIKDTNFPDKAIDLLDLSCSFSKISHIKKPKRLLKKEKDLVANLVDSASSCTEDKIKLLDSYQDAYQKWWDKINKYRYPITDKDVLEALSLKTGLPKNKFSNNDLNKYAHLDDTLKDKVFGQDEAVSKICKSLVRHKAGLKDPSKPIGTFLFLGPTGVGKTYLAKTLAKEFFVSEKSFIRLDMSEFSEETSVSKLVGSNPGYVGFESGGMLVELVANNPHSIVLFDEIEKAHLKVQQVLLQILDEGQLTDSMGRKASFTNSVIIVTGNIGSRQLVKTQKLGFNSIISEADKKSEAFDLLKKSMPLELINRFDEIVFFNNLKTSDIKSIIAKELKAFSLTSENLGSAKIRYSKSLVDFVYSKMQKVEFGAREIKRIIHAEVLDDLSDYVIKNPEQSLYSVSFNKKTNKITIKSSK